MGKIVVSGLVAGCVLLILSILGLYVITWVLPGIAVQYFDPVYDRQSDRWLLYYLHPFIISMALSWFWTRVKSILTGSFLSKGIEFGLIYVLVAILPMMWLIYSSMNVSIEMVASWTAFSLFVGVIAGLIFEKMNP